MTPFEGIVHVSRLVSCRFKREAAEVTRPRFFCNRADFRPPGSPAGCQPSQILDYLAASGVTYSAITRGEKPILFYNGDTYGEIPVEQVNVVDTLGAGDIFHGAFCYYFSRLNDFEAALGEASRVAAKSCQFFGTRQWMNTPD